MPHTAPRKLDSALAWVGGILFSSVSSGFIVQVEYHPHYVQEELKHYCDGQGIHLQAYSSLGTTVHESPLLQDPTVTTVAKSHSLCPAQVLLRWATQQGIGQYAGHI